MLAAQYSGRPEAVGVRTGAFSPPYLAGPAVLVAQGEGRLADLVLASERPTLPGASEVILEFQRKAAEQSRLAHEIWKRGGLARLKARMERF